MHVADTITESGQVNSIGQSTSMSPDAGGPNLN